MLRIARTFCSVSTIFFCLLPNNQLSAAQVPDYLCYMTTAAGQVIDLSESCRSQRRLVPTPSVDSLFLRDYEQAIARIQTNRNIREVLLKQSPESKIEYAQSVCNGLKAGLSPTQVQTLQSEQIARTDPNQVTQLGGVITVNIINMLAPKYYCPEFL